MGEEATLTKQLEARIPTDSQIRSVWAFMALSLEQELNQTLIYRRIAFGGGLTGLEGCESGLRQEVVRKHEEHTPLTQARDVDLASLLLDERKFGLYKQVLY